MIIFWFFIWVVLGVPLVEFIGYWIHRLIFHDGTLGSKLRRVHVKHHLEEYPPESLRPNLPEYKNAGDPLWHAIGAFIIFLLLMLTVSGAMQWWQSLALGIGSVLYAKYVVSIMHQQFHLPNSRLQKYTYFKKLVHFHDVHHYVRGNYGIVFLTMDRIFGTFQDTIPVQPQDIFPNYQELVRIPKAPTQGR